LCMKHINTNTRTINLPISHQHAFNYSYSLPLTFTWLRFPNNRWTLGNNHHVIMQNLNTAKALRFSIYQAKDWIILDD
jgi:hypothetical protein